LSVTRFRAAPQLGVGLLAICGLLLSCGGDPAPRPNILLIVLDDFGYNDLAINNGSNSPTPNLDELAQQGVRFTRHYAESSCSPSRIALLTGRYPAELGFHPVGAGLAPEVITLPEILADQGYQTHFVGKWHSGDAHALSRPEHHGFQHWFGFMSQLYLAGPHDKNGYRRGRPGYVNPWLENERGELRQYQGHLTELLTSRAMEIIGGSNTPWFLQLSYFAAHTPLQPSAEFAARHPDTDAGRYQALKEQLDSAIGRLQAALEATGQTDNTMVLVVSDNGGTARSWPSNQPYSGVKSSYHEGGIRTPLVLAWPDHWEGGRSRAEAASIMDLFPTVLGALGITAPDDLDGRDLFSDSGERELRWYSHSALGDAYSQLTGDGEWRLASHPSAGGNTTELWHRKVLENPNKEVVRLPEPGLWEALEQDTQAWIREATTVSGLDYLDTEGWREYSGDAFRRSPILAEYSLGMLLHDRAGEPNDAGEKVLVQQTGYLEIAQRGDELLIRVDGHEIVSKLPTPIAPCTTVVITALLSKMNQVFYSPRSRSTLNVYVNGVSTAQARFRNPQLNRASPENPLRVRTQSDTGLSMPAGAHPMISTRFLQAEQVSEWMHPALLEFCPAQPDNRVGGR
jgi:arylsulfatase A-like enzyme